MANFIEVQEGSTAILVNHNLITHITQGTNTTILHLVKDNPFNRKEIVVEKPYKTIRGEILQ